MLQNAVLLFSLLSALQVCIALLSRAHTHTHIHTHTHTHRHRLCAPLIADGAEGVEKTMAMMDEYLFSKEEFDVICTELRFNDIKVRARMPRHASMARSRCLACHTRMCLACYTRMSYMSAA